MQRKNLFDGDSYKAQFALITYRWLMSHRWVSYADIMADYIGVTTKELPANLSNCDGYGELKKVVGTLKKAIADKLEKDVGECFEEEGNNRNKRFDTLVRMMIHLQTCVMPRSSIIFVSTGSFARTLLDSSLNRGWSTSSMIVRICST